MLVLAHYPDGSTRDVTLDAIYSSSVPDVADRDRRRARSSAVRRGEAAILVRYEGAFGVDNLTVMGDRIGLRLEAPAREQPRSMRWSIRSSRR